MTSTPWWPLPPDRASWREALWYCGGDLHALDAVEHGVGVAALEAPSSYGSYHSDPDGRRRTTRHHDPHRVELELAGVPATVAAVRSSAYANRYVDPDAYVAWQRRRIDRYRRRGNLDMAAALDGVVAAFLLEIGR